MGLSRKRQRELKRLKRSAEHLWDEQREAIEHATALLRDARRQAANYAREEVAPRVRDAYEDRVRPVVKAGRSAASWGGERLREDVVPAITGALGSALAMLEAAKDPRVREVVRKVSRAGERAGVVTMPKKSHGPGRYILIGLGVVAAASVAYAAWQTLRADDDLWIEDVGEIGAADIDDEL